MQAFAHQGHAEDEDRQAAQNADHRTHDAHRERLDHKGACVETARAVGDFGADLIPAGSVRVGLERHLGDAGGIGLDAALRELARLAGLAREGEIDRGAGHGRTVRRGERDAQRLGQRLARSPLLSVVPQRDACHEAHAAADLRRVGADDIQVLVAETFAHLNAETACAARVGDALCGCRADAAGGIDRLHRETRTRDWVRSPVAAQKTGDGTAQELHANRIGLASAGLRKLSLRRKQYQLFRLKAFGNPIAADLQDAGHRQRDKGGQRGFHVCHSSFHKRKRNMPITGRLIKCSHCSNALILPNRPPAKHPQKR